MFTGGVPQDPPTTDMSFGELGLSEPVVRSLTTFGFEHPTPIQHQVIPKAFAGLDIVGLADRAKHYPRELSGGQEQRVAIARAIVSDPSLLLCDEPTGDLDRETADEILKLMQILNREHGKTIVMVTHDAQAAEFANRTLHCDKGTLEAREVA